MSDSTRTDAPVETAVASPELRPPADLELVPPAPVAPVAVESASGRVRLKPDAIADLDSQIREFIDQVTTLDAHDPKFKDVVDRIHTMGNRDIERSAGVSNRMLERPVKSMKNGLFDSGSDISRSLVDLRNTVEALDPSRQGDLFAPRKILGLIPMGSRLVDYFDQYRSSQTHINAIVEALRHGKDELLRDNAAVEQEKINIWKIGRAQV